MTNLEKYTTELVEREGILFSKQESPISYPEHGNESCFQIEENSFWFSHRNNCITNAVLAYCPDVTFFDIGGGNGYVASGLEKKGVQTVLIEPGIQGCLNAKKRNLQNIVCSTLENASFRKSSIPAIGLFDVVEHIENDVDFLASAHSFLMDNGLIFITVPAFNALWSNDDVEAGHFRRYTRKALEEKLKAVGFKIEYSTYIFSVLVAAVFLFRALPSKLGFNKNTDDLDKYQKEHSNKKGLADKVLNWVWNFELNQINKKGVVPFGGSCFVVARKIKV